MKPPQLSVAKPLIVGGVLVASAIAGVGVIVTRTIEPDTRHAPVALRSESPTRPTFEVAPPQRATPASEGSTSLAHESHARVAEALATRSEPPMQSPPSPTTLAVSMEGLAHADFLKVDQVGTGAVPGQVDLRGASLPGASLANIDLSRVEVSHADLRQADLRNSLLGGRFYQANLAGADLTEADLRTGNFSYADLSAANMQRVDASASDGPDGRVVVNFTRAILRNADLREANLGGASFMLAILTSADLRGADLRGALHLGRADLRGAVYDRRTLFHAGFNPSRAGMLFQDDSDD